ncbi:beta-lactamase domain protein [Acidovorax delafieldii 2AN]|jgi:glyoxylase-like metal-dependent hydrolase (beta-lactamase superfamily II)|uniref:Beta-lactamase domain protein n=1 Tax=Acidovorax delafieldii 2AN TaxID=573060 RepID=C5SZL5_ACIDE|nr:MBL fold metallo-hydrolase [Acidovorax delafieldii]EER62411.1 beta-lactamase domain protein [Acidovorax delafieldii 2AN]
MAKPDTVALTYPFEPPTPRHTVEVAPGVRWIRLSMPFRLDHINVWAIDTDDGWVLVDTGLNDPATVADWLALIAQGPLTRPLQGVYATHMHPDHIGLAGWFTRRAGVPLHMSRLEYLSCRVMHADTNREAPPDGVRFYRRAGWSEAALESYRSRFGSFGKHIHALPESFVRLQDGDHVQMGLHSWRAITTGGHSPEHVCLYSKDLKLLIAGDQVLPRISSNVSVFASEPQANPLKDWYESQDRLKREVSADVLVLPSHNEPFYGLHERLASLKAGQDQALERLHQSLCSGPQRIVDVFPALFRRAIGEQDGQQLSLATGEAVACMNYLIADGAVECYVDESGVAWYSLKP